MSMLHSKKILVTTFFVILLVSLTSPAFAPVGTIVVDAPPSIGVGTTQDVVITLSNTTTGGGYINVYDDDAWFGGRDDLLGSASYVAGQTEVRFPLSAYGCQIYGGPLDDNGIPTGPLTGETSAEIFATGVNASGETVTSNTVKVACDWDQPVIIPPSGGVVGDEMGKITIPPGALATDTVITLETFPIPAPFATPAGQEILVARRVGPSGLTFLNGKKATIAIPYGHDEDAAALDESSIQAFEFNTSTNQWVPIPSTIDRVTKAVIIETTHFSIYGIGGEPPEVVPATSTLAIVALGLAGLAMLLARNRSRRVSLN